VLSTLEANDTAQWLGAKIGRRFKYTRMFHVQLPSDVTVEEAIEFYEKDPNIEYAEPNYLRYVTAKTPDDTFYIRLWGLHNTGQSVNGTAGTADADVDAPAAWDITTGSSDVIIAVIDTGVDYGHPDLSDNIWNNSGEAPDDGIDNDGNGYPDDVNGWDFVDDENDPIDSHGHGSHVAGTIAAKGDNGGGITGLCWDARIMPLKAGNAFGQLTTSAIIDATDYAIDNGAKIINASYGGIGYSQAEYEAIDRAMAAGVLFVAAAGNSGSDTDQIGFYPAGYDLANIIAVASTDQDDELSWFSNYGATSVDVAAPGENIYSAQPGRQTAWNDDFDDGNIDDWTVDALWGLSNTALSGSWSISDSPIGPYDDDIDITAEPTAAFDLSGESGAKLTFKLRGVSASGDLLYVETATNGAGPWTNRAILIGSTQIFANGVSGSSNNRWLNATVDLGPLDGEASVFFRFRFHTNLSGTQDGWYIDDVALTVAGIQDTYRFLSGTSMTAPHVAGLAGLIWADDDSLTHTEVKNRILNGREVKTSLEGKMATGGRINAHNSLQNVLPSPSNLSATAVSSSQIDLSWSDNSYGETDFTIERKQGADGTYAVIATVGGDTTSHSDTGLSTSTTYYYRIKAHNSISNTESTYSSEASATTPAPLSGSGGGGCFVAAATHS
jgi:subtilisin family serine protease